MLETSEKMWEIEREKLMSARIKNRRLFVCALNWLQLLESGRDVIGYFTEREYKKIGIYGAGELAELLVQEMEKSQETQVGYLLDQTAAVNRKKYGYPMYLPEEFAVIEDVDMIVVTAITYFESISEALIRIRPEIPVVSLENIIKNRISDFFRS